MKIVKAEFKSDVAKEYFEKIPQGRFKTILADPPWRFTNRTGKVAPEHKRLNRYGTLPLEEIMEMPVKYSTQENAHLYLWVPNALLEDGLAVLKAWGFQYKGNIIWHKVRKDGGPDGRGVGFYFRNTTEIVLFGIKGRMRTQKAGRSQVNIIRTQKQEHSRKPDELYEIIERCSPGPFLEIFARGKRDGWEVFGNQAENYEIEWKTYANNSRKDSKTKTALATSLRLELEDRKKGQYVVKAKKVKRTKK